MDCSKAVAMSKKITPNQAPGADRRGGGPPALSHRWASSSTAAPVLEAGVDGIAEVMDNGQAARPHDRRADQGDWSRRATSSEDNVGLHRICSAPKTSANRRPTNLPGHPRPLPEVRRHLTTGNDVARADQAQQTAGSEFRQEALDVLDARRRRPACRAHRSQGRLWVLRAPARRRRGSRSSTCCPCGCRPRCSWRPTPRTVAKKAAAILLERATSLPRFDWVIKGESFWSFSGPARDGTAGISLISIRLKRSGHDLLAFHEDVDEQHNFSFLLRQALDHQVREHLNWDKDRKLFYFKALAPNEPRVFAYEASKKKAETEVVNVIENKDRQDPCRVRSASCVRAEVRNLYDQWFLVIEPTYFFTTNGFVPHPHPSALLAGKKRLDKSASLRGQVIMWHRFLTSVRANSNDLFAPKITRVLDCALTNRRQCTLATRVPEDVWGSQKKSSETEAETEDLLSLDEV